MSAKVTTLTGSIYHVTGSHVTGGSRDLVDGHLVSPLVLGQPMLISTPERAHLFPWMQCPAILTSTVVSVAPGGEG